MMNKTLRNILFLLLFFCYYIPLSAQSRAVDSLKALIAVTPDHKKEKINNYNFLSSLLSYQKVNEAIAYAQKALVLAEKYNDTIGKINAYRQIGIAYMNINYDSAKVAIQKSIEVSKKYGKKKAESSALNTLGNIYLELSQTKEALDCYLKALKLSEEVNDKMNIPMRLVNVGRTHLLDRNYSQGKSYFERAILSVDTIGKNKNINALSYALLNMGQLMEEVGNLDSAKIYCEKAIEVEKGSVHQVNKRESLVTLASIYQKKGNFALANQYLQESLQEAIQAQDNRSITEIYNRLSKLAQAQKNWQVAIDYGKSALLVADSIHLISAQKQAYLSLSESYAGIKNFEEAYQYHLLYKETSDSILILNKSAQMRELQTQYEVAKKETENEVLKRTQVEKDKNIRLQRIVIGVMALMICLVGFLSFSLFRSRKREKDINQQLQEKNSLLESSNIVKDKLFSIIAHDLRAPIHSLKSMMGLFVDNILSEMEVRSLFAKLIKEMDYTAELLDSLLEWAKSQLQGMTPKVQNVDIQAITSSTVGVLAGIADKKAIVVRNEIQSPLAISGDEDMLKTVLRNLLANALKFTPQGGEVRISAETLTQEVVIKVADNGVGMSEEVLAKLFQGNITTRGTQNEKGTGLGLLMVKDFIEKNKGTIQVESAIGKGSVFIVRLPL